MFPQVDRTGHVSAGSAPGVTTRCEILRTGPQDPAPLRVLVVDDEPLMRWSIAESLRDRRYRVIEAADGAEALRALASAAVDVIVLDYRLPDSGNLSLLARIRQIAPLAPVVMITAHSSPEIAGDARRLGADAVIEKPFEMRTLAAMLANARQAQ